ncbi:hypothetical protein O6H91_21G036100 [Diphasiastrum complanatum]|uniref:Uncharacterized protein n=1 Tax=Diphasiastrum complanatum TaxID=34168 RepID=A0ACC2AJH0_DIPCM|nr:hypothetical protein O6H91_21G036100 [Diphasiastrum complanatum]
MSRNGIIAFFLTIAIISSHPSPPLRPRPHLLQLLNHVLALPSNLRVFSGFLLLLILAFCWSLRAASFTEPGGSPRGLMEKELGDAIGWWPISKDSTTTML